MPAVLAVSSYPYRTSPVLRGAWILDSILGTPPPPPPANVPPLEKRPRRRRAEVGARAVGAAPGESSLRELPQPDRPVGVRAGELRRHWPVAERGGGKADGRSGELTGRHEVRRPR